MKKRIEQFIPGEQREGFFFCSPLILLSVVFILLPVMGTLAASFLRDVTFLPTKLIFFQNFSRLFADAHFWQAFRFTLLFVFVSVFLELILGLVFALILNAAVPGSGWLRAAVLIPWAIPVAISARVWQLIYNFEYGSLNYIILKLGLADQPVNWLGTPAGAFVSLVVSDVWKTAPFIALILLAGLSVIPGELYKQAMIDGANAVQRFFRITLPSLRLVLVVALLFRTIDAIRIFDLIYVLTGGGPGGSTNSLSLYAYHYYLSGDYGYGSALSVIIFIIASALAVTYIRVGRFGEALK